MLIFKTKPLLLISMTKLMLSTASLADVYFKNNFEPNISNCNNTLVNLARQEQPSSYFLEVGGPFGSTNLNPIANFALNNNQYSSLFFVAPETSANNQGRLVFFEPIFNQGVSDGVTMTISECQGDFTTHLDQPNCKVTHNNSGTFFWSLEDSSTSTNECLLIPGKAYYLNLIHSTDGANGYQQTSCISDIDGSCGIFFTSAL